MEIANVRPNNTIKPAAFLVVVTYLAFISLGLPDGLLGIAWPFMSARSNVPLDYLGILLLGFTSGYLSTSSTSGKIMKHISLGMLLTVSCLLTALSLIAYALVDAWHIMIVASFFLGSGGGAIDSSINTFAATKFSASTVNWLHAFYGVGATTGPLVVTLMLSIDLKWYHAYITVALIQFSLALLFLLTRTRWQVSSGVEEHHSSSEYLQTLKLPIVWVSVIIFFLYTGLEQGFGQWLFTILTESRGMSEESAGLLTGSYWGSLTIGRVIFGILLTKIPVRRVLFGAMIGIVAGITFFTVNLGSITTITGIVILGIAVAPVFPSLISITPERIGKEHSATAIGAQISMAMLGGALVPGFAGSLSDGFGLEVISKVFLIAGILLACFYFLSTSKK